jgi:DNA polymerase III epsilon subunit-like protein
MRILVFDTETTGLPEKNASILEVDKWPHIIQLSYLIYDTINNKIESFYDFIINIHDNIISDESIKLHKITKEKSNNEGLCIRDVLNKFNSDIKNVDLLVAHNISFDKRIIMVECIRNNISQYFTRNKIKKPEYCTMKESIDICKIERISSIGNKYFKYPTLTELYVYLFNNSPKVVHNSLADILICLRCYLLISNKIDIINLNNDIDNMLFEKYVI